MSIGEAIDHTGRLGSFGGRLWEMWEIKVLFSGKHGEIVKFSGASWREAQGKVQWDAREIRGWSVRIVNIVCYVHPKRVFPRVA